MGMTVSTPISTNVGAGQLVAHIWYPTQITAARMMTTPIYHGISRGFREAACVIEASDTEKLSKQTLDYAASR
jgi:hypothetical protein